MSLTSNPGGRVLHRLEMNGTDWSQYDVHAIADDCLTTLGVDPGEVGMIDLLQIAARHRVDLRAGTPCPNWCTEGEGHAYSHIGDLTRFHRRRIGSSDVLGIEVQIEALETKSEDGEVTADDLAIDIRLLDGERDPASLRQLAALLLDAADSADVALGGQRWTEDEL